MRTKPNSLYILRKHLPLGRSQWMCYIYVLLLLRPSFYTTYKMIIKMVAHDKPSFHTE